MFISMPKTNFIHFFLELLHFKGNRQFVQKVTFEPLMDFKHNYFIEVGNIAKAATSKSFLHLRYKKTQLLFLWQCSLIFS